MDTKIAAFQLAPDTQIANTVISLSLARYFLLQQQLENKCNYDHVAAQLCSLSLSLCTIVANSALAALVSLTLKHHELCECVCLALLMLQSNQIKSTAHTHTHNATSIKRHNISLSCVFSLFLDLATANSHAAANQLNQPTNQQLIIISSLSLVFVCLSSSDSFVNELKRCNHFKQNHLLR